MKKFLEISAITLILIYFLYLVWYLFYFDDFCSNYSSNLSLKYAEDIDMNKLAKCNDSFICEITDRKNISKENKLETWECTKKEVKFLELDYYLNKFNK